MTEPGDSPQKVPAIVCDRSSWEAFRLFNANEWEGKSKAIIQSCAAQYSLMMYTNSKLKAAFKDIEKLCQPALQELQSQWKTAPWDLNKCSYFADIPGVHLYIHNLLSSVKTFLDLLVQLLTSEQVVAELIHGFHKRGDIIGGAVINVLENNARNSDKASQILSLIDEHRQLWIDTAILLRDNLTHPEQGFWKLGIGMELDSEAEGLVLRHVVTPSVDGECFDTFAERVVEQAGSFSEQFLQVLKDK